MIGHKILNCGLAYYYANNIRAVRGAGRRAMLDKDFAGRPAKFLTVALQMIIKIDDRWTKIRIP